MLGRGTVWCTLDNQIKVAADLLMTIGPLLLPFLIFQRKFIQAFITPGIK